MDRELLAAQSGGKLLPELCSLLENDSNERTPPDIGATNLCIVPEILLFYSPNPPHKIICVTKTKQHTLDLRRSQD